MMRFPDRRVAASADRVADPEPRSTVESSPESAGSSQLLTGKNGGFHGSIRGCAEEAETRFVAMACRAFRKRLCGGLRDGQRSLTNSIKISILRFSNPRPIKALFPANSIPEFQPDSGGAMSLKHVFPGDLK